VVMVFPDIRGFQFSSEECIENGVGSVIDCNGSSSYITGDHLTVNSNGHVPLNKIDCFYAFPSKEGNGFDVKIFYKNTNVESLGRTEDHESAKRWIEESNGLLSMFAHAKC